MLPTLTIRHAVGPGDEATSQIRHAVLPSGQRTEAIQKILDALSRHLSGKEVLSRDALVRLIEDLARILKFPPLPQESGRDFVKRLIGFLQSMPMPERLLLERQLGGRSLAHRLAVLAAMPSGGSSERTAGANTARPQSLAMEAVRNLPVQTAAPTQFAAIRASASIDVALLQSILKRTFGADDEGDPVEAMLEAGDEMPKDGQRSDAARTPDARLQRTQASPRQEMESAAPAAGGGTEGEAAETDAALPQTEPEGEVANAGVDAAGTRNTAGEAADFDAPPFDPTLPAMPEDAEQTASDTETSLLEREPAEAAGDDGLDVDGTYGRRAPDTEGNEQSTRPAGPRGEPGGQAAHFSADAVKVIVREGVALPEILSESGAPAEPKGGGTGQQVPATPSESEAAEHSPFTRPRNETTGAVSMSDPGSADEPERTAALRSAIQAKASKPGDDPTMQQMITRLVENWLPHEAIPFALVPYLPAKADAEDAAGKADRQERTGDGGNDAGADAEADEGDREAPEGESSDGGAEEKSDEPGAIDAYDLYRRLGGLG